MKIVIVVALVLIVGALASAGLFMVRGRDDAGRPAEAASGDTRMARALALRVALSIGIFALVMLGWWLGWITPGGLPVAR